MKLITGTALLGAAAFALWRLTLGVESWLASSRAGDTLGWAVVFALALTVFALPVAAWGIATRAWLVRLRSDERMVSTVATLVPPPERPERPDPPRLPEPPPVAMLPEPQRIQVEDAPWV